MNPIIELKDIYFKYNSNKNSDKIIFKKFNLTILKGEKIAILGDNGSGKTTLLKILNGLIFPQKGIYRFNENIISKKTLKNKTIFYYFRKNCTLLFQNTDLMLFHPLVYDDLAFSLRILKLSETEIQKRIYYYSEIFNIRHLLKENSLFLSSGQKKIIALASLFILEPEVFLFDEPFYSLDNSVKKLMLNIIKESNKTFIISEHNYEIINKICNSKLTLNKNYIL